MPSTTLYDRTGASVGSVELNDELFAAPVNAAVLHQVVTAQLAGRRTGTADTRARANTVTARPALRMTDLIRTVFAIRWYYSAAGPFAPHLCRKSPYIHCPAGASRRLKPDARAPTARDGRKFAGESRPACGSWRHGGEQGLCRAAP